jgi:hypothetical protein
MLHACSVSRQDTGDGSARLPAHCLKSADLTFIVAVPPRLPVFSHNPRYRSPWPALASLDRSRVDQVIREGRLRPEDFLSRFGSTGRSSRPRAISPFARFDAGAEVAVHLGGATRYPHVDRRNIAAAA